MAKSSKSQKRANRELRKIHNAGITAFAIGLMLLVAPAFLKSSKLLAPLAAQLGSLAYWMIFIGIGLLGLYAVLKPKDENEKEYSPISEEQPRAVRKSAIKQNTHKPQSTQIESIAEPNFFSQLMKTDNAQPTKVWSKQVFADIEWRRFEAVCEKYFAQVGFKTEAKSHGADGGVDVWIYSENAVGPVSIAQCKHYRGRNEVTAEQMQAFYGVMSFNNLSRGTFITSSTYTAPAQAFANKAGIHMLDGDKFLKQILSRTTEQQQELLQVAYEGDYATPTCVNCGIKLIKKDKTYFQGKNWRCKNYVFCKTEMY